MEVGAKNVDDGYFSASHFTYSEVRKLWLNDLLFIWKYQTRLWLRDCIKYYPYLVINFLFSVLKLKNIFELLILVFNYLLKFCSEELQIQRKLQNEQNSYFFRLELANCDLRTQCGSLPDFVNQVLLIHRVTNSFTHYLWLFHVSTAELISCDVHQRTHMTKNIYSGL